MHEARQTPLPIDPFVPRVIAALRSGRDVVLVAEPGAGKTTRIAPAIIGAGLLGAANDKLVMLQPRRVAARAAAARIAFEQGWTLGDQVGYQVRHERVFARHTPLRVVTEGILVRWLVGDPELGGVGCVVLDEFHERSIHSDLSLAMLRGARGVRRDLRLVVMSATIDAKTVATFLGGPAEVEILEVPGRLFPVDVQYLGDSPEAIEQRVSLALRDVLSSTHGQRGDVLVFLPGVREIERTLDSIRPGCRQCGYEAVPLHGTLTKLEQDAAVSFDPAGPPRVICATNIAETSLTLPGVRLVVDSGFVRQAGYDASRGLETLTTQRISKASAEQRRGRAGRVAAGRCLRLWSKMTQHRLADFDVPEIRRVDLAETMLAVRAWGGDPASFAWFEAPEPRLLAAAQTLLEMLGAVESGRLTPLGRALERLPLHPRLARLLTAAPPHLARQAATLAALIGEGAEVPGRRTANVHELLEAFERRQMDAALLRATARSRDAHLEAAGVDSAQARGADSLEEALLLAYPDRVCRRREGDAALARLVEGGGVRLPDPAAVRGDLFLALDVRIGARAQAREADVRLVATIEEGWLDRLPQNIVRQEDVILDERSGSVISLRRKRYRDLILQEQRGGTPETRAAEGLLRQHLVPAAPGLVAGDKVLAEVYRRWHFAQASAWSGGRHRLPPEGELIGDACAGATSRQEVLARARTAVQTLLSDPRNPINVLAPREIVVPSGTRVRLDWSGASPLGQEIGRTPVLAVRLQELFGLSQTPRVGAPPGTPVTLHILGPNFRPVQITDDLASFWRNVYPQVRKDLRAATPGTHGPKTRWPLPRFVARREDQGPDSTSTGMRLTPSQRHHMRKSAPPVSRHLDGGTPSGLNPRAPARNGRNKDTGGGSLQMKQTSNRRDLSALQLEEAAQADDPIAAELKPSVLGALRRHLLPKNQAPRLGARFIDGDDFGPRGEPPPLEAGYGAEDEEEEFEDDEEEGFEDEEEGFEDDDEDDEFDDEEEEEDEFGDEEEEEQEDGELGEEDEEEEEEEELEDD